MRTFLRNIIPPISLLFLLVGRANPQNVPSPSARGLESVAVLPFELQNLPSEDGLRLTAQFTDELSRVNRFSIMHPDTQKSIFADAGLRSLAGCNYAYCLSDMGKILGVQKVIYATVSRRGKLYVFHVRLVNVPDAALLYDERTDFSGEFGEFVSEVVPEQARKLGGARLEAGTQWYIVAAAILIGIGVIYWIYRSFDKGSGESDSGIAIPSGQH